MARAMFYLGRGSHARPLGWIETSREDFSALPDPDTIAALYLGRQALAATEVNEYVASIDGLITAWRTAGLGAADTVDAPHAPGEECPALNGAYRGADTAGCPAYRVAYALEGDHLW